MGAQLHPDEVLEGRANSLTTPTSKKQKRGASITRRLARRHQNSDF
jgi:hypothetical protein